MILGLIFLSTFINLSEQYEGTEFSRRTSKEPHNFLQYNSVHEPTHFQFSSLGSQSSSIESNIPPPGEFVRRPYVGYQNGLDDKTRDFEDHQRINKFPVETREYESRQSDEKFHGMSRDFERRNYDGNFQGPKEFVGRPRNDKYHGTANFEPRERNDKYQGMKDLQIRRLEKFQGPRDVEPRNIRYEDGFRGVPENESGRPKRPSKPWSTSHYVENRGRQKRPRMSGSPRRARENFLLDGKRPFLAEVKRSPRIVKYIADKNGFAIREDLMKPLQDTLDRTRQESRRRIVTASAAGLPQSSLMSQVVTSAIRVAGQPPGGGEGKFLPQIFDLSVGKKQGQIDIDKLAYSLGAKELIV